MHLGELDIVNSCINQRLDMSEELLDVVMVPADDALSTSDMPCEVLRKVFPEVRQRQTSIIRGCFHLVVWLSP